MRGVRGKVKNRDRSSLESLARVIREVDSAPNMETALRIVVERTREIMAADVCTVYFTQHERQRHVIVATDGLSPIVVGHVQFSFREGLIGRVAESTKPVNLDRVPEQLDEGFLQQSAAGRFHGFLGVPITHRSTVQGVLVVRQRAARRFDDADAAYLTTLAAQLGGAIAYAKASGELCSLCRSDGDGPSLLEGLPGAPGIAIGTGVVVSSLDDLGAVPNRKPEDPRAEEQRLRNAVAQTQKEVRRLSENLEGTLSAADRALFEAYTLILDSPEIVEATVARIHQGSWAPGALRQTIEVYTRRFDEMEDPYLRERGADIRGLGNRILVHLQGASDTVGDYPSNTILTGRQLSAIDLGLAPLDRLRGIISEEGSSLSHSAILARALGIPAVMGVQNTPLEHLDSQEVVADGTRGRVYLRPNTHLREEIERLICEERDLEEDLKALRDLPPKTQDGVEVSLYTNAGLIADIPLMVAAGSAGIGLFRSELPFMLYDRFPSEQEQVEIYRQVLEAVTPRPVSLRTLDVGGDKPLPYLPIAEQNPALGWRGIRLTLDHPEIFLTQLRAALRANVGLGNLRLLLPMVNGVAEVEQALALIDRVQYQLLEEGVASSCPPVGLMIEVPSAVYQAEELARRVDFLSVGTNDLAQYLLAIDRDNPHVSKRLELIHPAVLRALWQVVNASRRTGKPVTVCGEMAGDPGYALLLLGLGFTSLSVNATALPRVKWAIRSVNMSRMESLAKQALMLERPEPIRQLLGKALEDAGLDRLLPRPDVNIADGNAPG
jgi:phosphotransferase system enzyme I (PtsP)